MAGWELESPTQIKEKLRAQEVKSEADSGLSDQRRKELELAQIKLKHYQRYATVKLGLLTQLADVTELGALIDRMQKVDDAITLRLNDSSDVESCRLETPLDRARKGLPVVIEPPSRPNGKGR